MFHRSSALQTNSINIKNLAKPSADLDPRPQMWFSNGNLPKMTLIVLILIFGLVEFLIRYPEQADRYRGKCQVDCGCHSNSGTLTKFGCGTNIQTTCTPKLKCSEKNWFERLCIWDDLLVKETLSDVARISSPNDIGLRKTDL